MRSPWTPGPPDFFGPEGVSDEDCHYAGSTFREVRDAVFAEPYSTVWDGPGKLPRYPFRLGPLLKGVLTFGRRYPFSQAAHRTVASHADLRWGPDRRGFRRLLHPNGVCLSGTWEVTQPTGYSGYFAQGQKGLVIARYSSNETRRGRTRSLALVGKIYPTTDPDSTTRVVPANFITQEDIAGYWTTYINDAELLNAPNTVAWHRGLLGLPSLFVTGIVLGFADKENTQRQVYEVAELGKPAGEPTRSPAFMRLLVDPGQRRIEGAQLDFRDEILAQIYDPGNPEPQRDLVFQIEVTDEGISRGPAFHLRRTFKNWRRIGRLAFGEAVASYVGDFVLHFHHPAWRNVRNDPSSVARVRSVS
jgi:hypothetical protein